MITHWSAAYIGIPWVAHGRTRRGCDRWGLVRLVLAAEAEIDVPSYAGAYVDPQERTEIIAIVEDERRGVVWTEIPREEASAFDLVLFEGGDSLHVGIVALPARMLHVAEGGTSELVELRVNRAWRDRPRIIARHRMLMR